MESKFAEKLTILNTHAYGLCCRLFLVKQNFETSRPDLLNDKSFDSHVRQHIKKYPLIEIPKDQGTPVGSKKDALMDLLDNAYFTMVDFLEFKGTVLEVITAMAAQGVHLDITLNYELSKQFLTLLTNYACLFILLSRIQDRRIITALYSCAYEASKGAREPSFHRLGQLIVDYDDPLRQMHKDFAPHIKIIADLLATLRPEVEKRHLSADMLRKNFVGAILHNHAKMSHPVECDFILTESCSSADLVRWLSFGYLLVPSQLFDAENAAEQLGVLDKCLMTSYATLVFRTETINLFSAFEAVIASQRDAKRLSKLKAHFSELQSTSVPTCLEFHYQRRLYLRHTLRQHWNIVSDKPGLLGPKAPMLLSTLHLAKDEVLWLFRHSSTAPPKSKGKPDMELLRDRELPELLFLLTEMKFVFLQYRELVQRYNQEYLAGADTAALGASLQSLNFKEDERAALNAGYESISNLAANPTSLRGLRLDWLRVQAAMSTAGASAPLTVHTDFATVMNNISFHSSLYDACDKVLHEATDLSDLWFYKKAFVDQFNKCLASNNQLRFSTSFASVCDSFSRCATDFVPEERQEIGKDAANMSNFFLQKIATTAANLVHDMAMQHVRLGEQMLPTKAAANIAQKAAKQAKGKGAAKSAQPPGLESQARSKDQITSLRQIQKGLCDLCWALNNRNTIVVYNYVFTPKEYLTELLEKSFGTSLLRLVERDGSIVRPSVCLANVKSYMAALRSIENYINIDVSSIFSSGFLDQSLYTETSPGTVATHYIKFYVELVKNMKTSSGIYMSSTRRSLVSKAGASFRAEQFTDVTELRALCTLLGPFGIKQLDTQLLHVVDINVTEMKKLTLFNRDHLEALKSRTDNAQVCSDACKHLKELDTFIADSLAVGVVLEFRKLTFEALSAVLEQRVPFIFRAINDLHSHTSAEAVNLLAMTAGIRSTVDPQLKQALLGHSTNSDADFNAWSLMMVMFAASFRHLSASNMELRANLEAFENNAQVLASTVNELSAVLFSICAAVPEETDASIREAQSEFLRVAAALMLRLGTSADKDSKKGRDAMLMVIDQFVLQSKMVSADILQSFLPYGLIRCAYTNLHKKQRGSKKARDE